MNTIYFDKRSDAASGALVALHLLVVVSPIYLAAAVGPGWQTAGCWLFFGLSMNGLLNLMHECAHYHVFRTRRGSDILGKLVIAPFVFADFDDYRRRHWDHHRFLGREGETKDTYLIDVRGATIVTVLIRCALGMEAVQKFFKSRPAEARRDGGSVPWVRNLVVFQLLFIASLVLTAAAFNRSEAWLVAIYYAGVAYGVVYLYGLISLTVFMASLRAIAEHQPCGDGSAAAGFAALRNFACGPVSRYLMGAYGFGEHYTHHENPGIPYYHLPAATVEMARGNPMLQPEKTYLGVLAEIVRR